MKKILVVKIIAAFLSLFLATVMILILNGVNSGITDTQKSPDYRIEGKKNAKIVIIEYSDFACPACANMNFYIKNLIKYFPEDFEINFKHFPLTNIHPYSFNAAVWVECAGIEENKFFEVGDLFFKNQKEWWNNKDYIKLFEKYTKEAKADVERIKKCFNESKTVDIVKKDIQNADKMKLNSTPTFFVNGKIAVGGMELVEAIKKEKER